MLAWGGPPARADKQPSHLSLEANLSLKGILKALEERVPRQIDQWGKWQTQSGLQVQYRVWRGPIRLGLSAGRLIISVDLGYRLKARKRLLKLVTLAGSCGVDEPPRAARLTLSLGLSVSQDWRLRTEPGLYPLVFGAPCRMTALDVDVTPILRAGVERELGKALRTRFAERVAEDTRLHDTATALWRRAQHPIELARGVWLSANPQRVSLAPPQERDGGVGLDLSLAMTASLATRLPAPVAPTPLPPLQVLQSLKPGFRLQMDFTVDEAGAVPLLEKALSLWGTAAALLSVEKARIDGTRVELTVRAFGNGPHRLVFLPRLEAESGDLSLRLQADDSQLQTLPVALRWLLQGLADTDWPLNGLLDQLARSAEDNLSGDIAPDVRLDTHIDALRPKRLELADGELTLRMWIEGRSRVSLR